MIYRVLDPSEYGKIPDEATGGLKIPETNTRVVAALDDSGAVVAVWCAIAVVHLEPLWIREDRRKSNTILKRLWETLRNTLKSEGVRMTLTVIADNVPVTKKVAEWCGAKEFPGKVYFLDLGA